MNDLVPLLDTSDSARTRALLRAGRGDTPPSHFSERLLLGLGLAGAVASLTAAASAHVARSAIAGAVSKGSGATSLMLVAAKWVAVGVVGGGILAGGVSVAVSPRLKAPVTSIDAKRASKAPAAQRSAPRASDAAELSVPVPVASAEPAESKPVRATPLAPASATSSAQTSAHDGQLGYEVRLIDRTREALAAGDFARASLELDTFEHVTKTGVLDREARILRIDVLQKLGQSGRARVLAGQYLKTYPNDAHAARLRALAAGAASP